MTEQSGLIKDEPQAEGGQVRGTEWDQQGKGDRGL